MEKRLVGFMILLLVGISACSSVVERARKDVNPLVGGTKSMVTGMLGSDRENPYLVRFVVEFDNPMKPDAFWTYSAKRELFRDGIKIYKMDKSGRVQLFTLDMRAIKAETGSFATSVTLNLGYNNPISGYPCFHRIAIRENKNVPSEERHKYLEATPLEFVLLGWNYEKQADEMERIVHADPLNSK